MSVWVGCLFSQSIHSRGWDRCQGLPHVRIGNDGSQVVNVWHLRAVLRACEHTLIIVLLVMQLLGTEDPVHLIRDGGVWVVSARTEAR